MLPNRVEHVLADLGVVHAGGVPVTFYPALAGRDHADTGGRSLRRIRYLRRDLRARTRARPAACPRCPGRFCRRTAHGHDHCLPATQATAPGNRVPSRDPLREQRISPHPRPQGHPQRERFKKGADRQPQPTRQADPPLTIRSIRWPLTPYRRPARAQSPPDPAAPLKNSPVPGCR